MIEEVIREINALFNNERMRKFLTDNRYIIGGAILIPIISYMKHDVFLVGFIISALGELIQLWSFASLKKNRELSTKGPYSIVRNPMYIGRFLLIGGIIFLLKNIWIMSLFVIIYFFYMYNRVKREELLLKVVFGMDYIDYCKRINRFFPSIRHIKGNDLFYFNWKFFIENHGHWNFVGFLIFYGFLWTIIVPK